MLAALLSLSHQSSESVQSSRLLSLLAQERSEKSILRGDANRNFRSESFVRVFLPRKHKFFRMEKFGEPNFPCGETEEDNFPATLL